MVDGSYNKYKVQSYVWTVIRMMNGEGGSYDFQLATSLDYKNVMRHMFEVEDPYAVKALFEKRAHSLKLNFDMVLISEAGLTQVNQSSGKGVWLAMSCKEENFFTDDNAIAFDTHNCDYLSDQLNLFRLWMVWIDFVNLYAEYPNSLKPSMVSF